MFLESFRHTGLAVLEVFLLSGIGYFLAKKNILDEAGLGMLSRLVIQVIFPIFIFSNLAKNFSFSLYPDWWVFPLISILVTVIGLAVGSLLAVFISGSEHKLQFLCLTAFQNSGYLPLALVSILLAPDKLAQALIYIFLFLIGFDLVMWSFGVYMLSRDKNVKFRPTDLFSPPVIASLFSLFLVFLGANKFIPEFIFKPLGAIGGSAVPLAMLVVGGNLAEINLRRVDKKAISLILLGKLLILPLLGLLFILKFNLFGLAGLLIIMQLAMPPATSLSVIMRHYKKEDLLISQGVFFGHLFCLVTIPLFLSLYFSLAVIK